MEEKVAWLDLALLTRFVVDVFLGLGVPQEEAKICADVVVAADELGIESHGIARLKSFYYDRIKAGIQFPVTNFEIIREGPTTAVVDGHLGMGQVIAAKSMELAMAKARRCGMGMVAVRNSSHYGIAGYYVAMAAKAGMIGITGTNARPSIAPTFGVENMLGTNPLAFGLPTDEEFPFILDGATSVTQRGKIELYARERKALPAGWVMDNQGNDVTDPLRALEDLERGRAALAPLGGKGEEGAGYKGYGYAAVVEILSTALQGGVFLKGLQKNLPEKGKGQKNLTAWGTSLWPSISPPLPTRKTFAGERGSCCALSGTPKRPRASSASIPPGRRSTWPNWSGGKKASPWGPPSSGR